jgi:wyosine [tRNA(Phe)-imidazoG37] synthetase (radical SAM superfamily)
MQTSPQPETNDCQPWPARNFHGNQFVYCVLSQRAGGLSIGINMNPDKCCDFDCVYCEVDRSRPSGPARVNIGVMIAELENMLTMVEGGRVAELGYSSASLGMLPFKEVALSGDGEPTLCPKFRQILEAVLHFRARRGPPFFKIVLLTNATGLHFRDTQAGIAMLGPEDEIWAKLDAGTQDYMNIVNRPGIPLDLVVRNIRDLGRKRPVIIQSLFPLIDGAEPPEEEILAYARTLRELKQDGAEIPLVQIYSAHRTAVNPACTHLPLRALSKIARTVREISGLNAEVF